jgi:hypothetical protein
MSPAAFAFLLVAGSRCSGIAEKTTVGMTNRTRCPAGQGITALHGARPGQGFGGQQDRGQSCLGTRQRSAGGRTQSLETGVHFLGREQTQITDWRLDHMIGRRQQGIRPVPPGVGRPKDPQDRHAERGGEVERTTVVRDYPGRVSHQRGKRDYAGVAAVRFRNWPGGNASLSGR